MRVLVVGHSLSHERQKIFYRYFSRYCDELLILAPEKWMRERTWPEVGDGYTIIPVRYFGGLRIRGFADYVRDFRPDVVYVNDEADYGTLLQVVRYKRELGYRIVLFSWDNVMHRYGWEEFKREIDAFIAGCPGAVEILKRKGCEPIYGPMIQVGVDCSLFTPMRVKEEFDTCTCAGWTYNKGVDLIEKVVMRLGLRHLWLGHRRPYDRIYDDFPRYGSVAGYLPYHVLPNMYRKAKVHVLASRDTKDWKEQNAPYANLEALACGLSVVMTEAGDAPYFLRGCTAVVLVPQDNEEALKQAILRQLEERPSDPGFVRKRYSKEVVAKTLKGYLEAVL